MASIRETDAGTYEVLYRDPNNRQRSRTFKRKTDARNFAKSVDTDKARGDWLDPALGKRQVKFWADDWYSTVTGSPRTLDYYAGALRNYVLPELGDMPIVKVDRAVVRSFLAKITGEMNKSASTRNGALKALRGTMGYAVDAGAVKVNPCFGLRLSTGSRDEKLFLTPAQVTDLAGEMPTATDALMVTFTAYTGLRAGEVGALRRRHFSGRKVAVYENVVEDAKGVMHTRATKNYTRRDVAMPQFLADRMAEHLTGLAEDDYVFPAPDGGQMRHTNWYERHYKPAVRAAESVPDELRFHDLRHTCAAMLISVGANPRAVMQHLGHASISVTFNTYGHLFPGWDDTLTEGLQKLYEGQ